MKKKTSNKKLYNLLHNNEFLVNSSLCLVLLLCLCYLGISSPVKKTYSAGITCYGTIYVNADGEQCIPSTSKQLYGDYLINNNSVLFPFQEGEGSYDFDIYDIKYEYYEYINFNYNNSDVKVVTITSTEDNPNRNAVYFSRELDFLTKNPVDLYGGFNIVSGDTTNVGSKLSFNSVQSPSDRFYNWLTANTTPDNKCYYNETTKRYYWNNAPSTGILRTGYGTEEDCEALNRDNVITLTFSTEYGGYQRGDIYRCQEYYDDGVTCYEYDFVEYSTYTHSMKIGATYDLSLRDDFKVEFTGYELVGWNSKFDGSGISYKVNDKITITDNVTLYAQWEEIADTPTKYTVIYDANGGNSILPVEVEKDSSITLPTPTRTGYSFRGWYTEKTGGDKVNSPYKVTSSIKLYAQWELIEEETEYYTVIFHKNGGDYASQATATVQEGKAITKLATVTRSGYEFIGWYTEKTGGDLVTAPYTPTGNITLYAHWKEVEVKVNLGDYDVSGKYIYLDFEDTLSDLEENIKVTPSTYKVNLPSKIVTGAKITILNASNEKYDEYIIIMLGDVDGSGTLNARDYIGVYNHLDPKDSFALNEVQQKAADVDDNGEIETLDYIYIYSAFKLMEGN